jgi:hypothetical protein
VTEAGPQALLLRADLLQTLRGKGYDILWTLWGEQRVLIQGVARQHKNYAWYNLWGAWRYTAGKWEGEMKRRNDREEAPE